jgi:hypothetical protein
LYSLRSSKLNLKDASGWFKVFYRGLDNPLLLPYAASDSFENPITFRLDNFSLNYLSLLQQQDGPGPEHDDLSFSYLLVAPVVVFCKNAPPMSKIIQNRQHDSSKLASKRK